MNKAEKANPAELRYLYAIDIILSLQKAFPDIDVSSCLICIPYRRALGPKTPFATTDQTASFLSAPNFAN
jgi:hypothetical protein